MDDIAGSIHTLWYVVATLATLGGFAHAIAWRLIMARLREDFVRREEMAQQIRGVVDHCAQEAKTDRELQEAKWREHLRWSEDMSALLREAINELKEEIKYRRRLDDHRGAA